MGWMKDKRRGEKVKKQRDRDEQMVMDTIIVDERIPNLPAPPIAKELLSPDTAVIAVMYKQPPDRSIQQSKYNPKTIKHPVKSFEWFPSLKNYLIMEFDRKAISQKTIDSMRQDIDIINASQFVSPNPTQIPQDKFYVDNWRTVDTNPTGSTDPVQSAGYSQIMLKSWHGHEDAVGTYGYGDYHPTILMTDTRVEPLHPDLNASGKVEFAFDSAFEDIHYNYPGAARWAKRCHGTSTTSIVTANTDDMNSTAEWTETWYDPLPGSCPAGTDWSDCLQTGNVIDFPTYGGMAGNCPNCNIKYVSVYGTDPTDGVSLWYAGIESFEYALDNDIKVINASWGKWGGVTPEGSHGVQDYMTQDAANEGWCGKDSTWVYESHCEGFGYIENGQYTYIEGSEILCTPAGLDTAAWNGGDILHGVSNLLIDGGIATNDPVFGMTYLCPDHAYDHECDEPHWVQQCGGSNEYNCYFVGRNPDTEPVMQCSHPGARGAYSSDPDDEFSYLIPFSSSQSSVSGFWYPYGHFNEWWYCDTPGVDNLNNVWSDCDDQSVPPDGLITQGIDIYYDSWSYAVPDRACQMSTMAGHCEDNVTREIVPPNGVMMVASAGNIHWDQNPNNSYDINGNFIRLGREVQSHSPSGYDNVLSVTDSNHQGYAYDSSCPYPTATSNTSGWYSELGPCHEIDVSAPGYKVMAASADKPNSVESCKYNYLHSGPPNNIIGIWVGERCSAGASGIAGMSDELYDGWLGAAGGIYNNCCYQFHMGNECYYRIMNGTSFSAPLVSGMLGLLLSHEPDLTNEQLRDIIHTTNTKPTWTDIPSHHDLIPYSSGDAEPKPQSFDVYEALKMVYDDYYSGCLYLPNDMNYTVRLSWVPCTECADWQSGQPSGVYKIRYMSKIDLTLHLINMNNDEIGSKELPANVGPDQLISTSQWDDPNADHYIGWNNTAYISIDQLRYLLHPQVTFENQPGGAAAGFFFVITGGDGPDWMGPAWYGQPNNNTCQSITANGHLIHTSLPSWLEDYIDQYGLHNACGNCYDENDCFGNEQPIPTHLNNLENIMSGTLTCNMSISDMVGAVKHCQGWYNSQGDNIPNSEAYVGYNIDDTNGLTWIVNCNNGEELNYYNDYSDDGHAGYQGGTYYHTNGWSACDTTETSACSAGPGYESGNCFNIAESNELVYGPYGAGDGSYVDVPCYDDS